MGKHLDRYHQILAGRGMKVGDQVICTYRCPTPHQWWIHPWWVGVIEEASEEPIWDGPNSEASYCANYLYVKVRYLGANGSAGFTQRDQLASLLPIQFGDLLTESPHFGSDPAEAIRLFQFACRAGVGERYAEESQKAWHELNRQHKETA